MLFQPFKKATGPKMSAMEAEFKRAEFDQKAKADANSLRSGNLLGGAELYSESMGDKSPIADYMFGGGESPPPVETGYDATAAGGIAPAAGGVEAASGAATAAGGGAAEAALATQAAGGSAAAGGSSALASMGPAGWAALAAMALMNYG